MLSQYHILKNQHLIVFEICDIEPTHLIDLTSLIYRAKETLFRDIYLIDSHVSIRKENAFAFHMIVIGYLPPIEDREFLLAFEEMRL